ncbi:MAG TPA: tyrosine/phenylalanine carboxypeptidase domain-containing protein [Polyangiaceae bacterium]|nr:tyrosine/phenylalanine carboxypeptidase domain-containing protein [Polyangiaceae bacterium]
MSALRTAPPVGCVPEGLERLVVRAAREIQLLAALTPIDACAERARLTAELRAGRRALPRWTYARPALPDDLVRALDSADRRLAGCAEPLIELYRARVRELSVEAALCAAVETDALDRLARERFAPADAAVEREAAELCAGWLDEPPAAPAPERPMSSDDPDPRSLLSRMRAAVGSARLPFAVVVQPALAPLAATGERVILVAAGRPVGEDDAVRTVVHEVEGHARPRARAAHCAVGLVRAATARGTDDQEGRALLLEQRAGLLGARRRRQLAARHRAVEAMLGGASFADVTSLLVDAHAIDPADAVIAAERVFRGSDGTRPGLGRERVYLQAFVRVRAHLAAHPDDERVLEAGQIAVDAVEPLRGWVAPAR